MTKGEQMLANLGYEAEKTSEVVMKSFVKEYGNWPKRSDVRIEFWVGEGVSKVLYSDGDFWEDAVDFSYDEILACAEIVKELREND